MAKKTKDVRCIHRHTIDEHPQCFAKGYVKDIDPDALKPWYQLDGTRIGYLDIEADNLYPDFSTMLSWAIKERGPEGKTAADVVTKRELFKGTMDKRIVKSCIDEMLKYNIIVTYNGDWYDIPYLRAKAVHLGLEFPGFDMMPKVLRSNKVVWRVQPTLYHWDLYQVVKRKIRLSRRSLANVCDYFGIVGKTPLDKAVWRAAKYGDKKALDLILEHNVGDIVILEELHDKLAPAIQWARRAL